MTIREARIEQWKSLKDSSLKEKLSFFWEYYGIKSICLIIGLAIAISFIVSIATQKDYAFTGIFYGASAQSSSDSYMSDFAKAAQIDQSKYQLSTQLYPDIRMEQQITTDIYQYMESFSAMVAAKAVDCFAGHIDLFLYYGYLGYATDLRTVLTPQELEALSPYLHYIDGQLIAQQESDETGATSAYSQRTDSTKPELMADPIPVAISIYATTEAFQNSYQFGEDAVIGLCASSSYPKNALAFLRYIFGL